MNSILNLSEVPHAGYDGGKKAKRAYAWLVALTLLFVTPPALRTISGTSAFFSILLFEKLTLLAGFALIFMLRVVYQAQRGWRWLDYNSLCEVFAAFKGNTALCVLANDRARPSGAPMTASPAIDAPGPSLTAAGKAPRKRTLQALRYCLFSTSPRVLSAIQLFMAGFLLSAASAFIPDAPGLAVDGIGLLFRFIAVILWFMEYYRLM